MFGSAAVQPASKSIFESSSAQPASGGLFGSTVVKLASESRFGTSAMPPASNSTFAAESHDSTFGSFSASSTGSGFAFGFGSCGEERLASNKISKSGRMRKSKMSSSECFRELAIGSTDDVNPWSGSTLFGGPLRSGSVLHKMSLESAERSRVKSMMSPDSCELGQKKPEMKIVSAENWTAVSDNAATLNREMVDETER